jgi:hypothetical protein
LAVELFGTTSRSSRSRGPTPTVQPLPVKPLECKRKKKKLKELYSEMPSTMVLTQGKAYFQQIGMNNPAPSYGHIHTTINTTMVGNHKKK